MLFVLNLLGYSIGLMTTDLEVERIIEDEERDPVATYPAAGSGTGYAAMFWGYSLRDSAVPTATETLPGHPASRP